jgi:hypothetical protein
MARKAEKPKAPKAPKGKRKIAKSAITGKIVSTEEAVDNPDTTFFQTVAAPPVRKGGGRRKAAPPKPDVDPVERNIFNLGRHARRNGRKRHDSPLTGKQGDLWRKGWDFQDRV